MAWRFCIRFVATLLALAHPPGMIAAPDSTTWRGRAMGTSWTVIIRGTQEFDAATLQPAISARLESLEQQFSTYRTRSQLSQFNGRPTTEWIPVSQEMIWVAAESQRISELTGGAFDVTVAPLMRLWGFGPQRRSGGRPGDEEIQRARAAVNWRQLEYREHPPALRKRHPNVEADFSSLVKGFAADSISELLSAAGVTDHLVQIGGDTRSGPGGSGRDWQVGVEPADLLRETPVAVVRLEGQALSTSGDYRNFFVLEGTTYGHIIDPRTGWPVNGSLAAISVVHRSCATSSALATALFVLGADDAFRFATEHHLACLLQIREGSSLIQRMTPEFLTLLTAP